MTGLVDWGNVMFTHAEFDVAITHFILSIGPVTIESDPVETLKSVDRIAAQYLTAYRSKLPLDDDLLLYYGTLSAAHAYAKVVSAVEGGDLRIAAHDAYSWKHPILFASIQRTLEKATGIPVTDSDGPANPEQA